MKMGYGEVSLLMIPFASVRLAAKYPLFLSFVRIFVTKESISILLN